MTIQTPIPNSNSTSTYIKMFPQPEGGVESWTLLKFVIELVTKELSRNSQIVAEPKFIEELSKYLSNKFGKFLAKKDKFAEILVLFILRTFTFKMFSSQHKTSNNPDFTELDKFCDILVKKFASLKTQHSVGYLLEHKAKIESQNEESKEDLDKDLSRIVDDEQVTGLGFDDKSILKTDGSFDEVVHSEKFKEKLKSVQVQLEENDYDNFRKILYHLFCQNTAINLFTFYKYFSDQLKKLNYNLNSSIEKFELQVLPNQQIRIKYHVIACATSAEYPNPATDELFYCCQEYTFFFKERKLKAHDTFIKATPNLTERMQSQSLVDKYDSSSWSGALWNSYDKLPDSAQYAVFFFFCVATIFTSIADAITNGQVIPKPTDMRKLPNISDSEVYNDPTCRFDDRRQVVRRFSF